MRQVVCWVPTPSQLGAAAGPVLLDGYPLMVLPLGQGWLQVFPTSHSCPSGKAEWHGEEESQVWRAASQMPKRVLRSQDSTAFGADPVLGTMPGSGEPA